MESSVFEHNFIEISTMIIADTVKSLDDKASSTRAFSQIYAGILGVQHAQHVVMGGGNNNDAILNRTNHPPSVVLSPAAKECVGDNSGDDNHWMNGWPNVTLPGYDAIGSSMLDVSNSRATVFCPLVWDVQEVAWEEYAANNALSLVKDVVSNGIRMSGLNQDDSNEPASLRDLQGENRASLDNLHDTSLSSSALR
eukprot:CAMPEP_0172322758 /NCGR_PEP_ID=MMETSP1058-20130122/46824_1 /TAXON_ID=83371 /ORGANISM="Detonula confervacea, Strain CCMP 353" /LENGTH=195 /DNA_ID=CAMNT_0013038581 /DNA_START=30 /DNA_END=614 /DNA_ORIENTATION=-